MHPPVDCASFGTLGNRMMNLNHPRTPHVFAASRQLDLILDYAKRITGSDRNGRQFMAHVVAPCFAALRWLNKTEFGDLPEIASAIDELQLAVQTLADKPAVESVLKQNKTSCEICNHSLTKPNEYDPIPYCSECLNIIDAPLTACDAGFGTDAI